MRTRRGLKSIRPGFTLIEILVTISIIVLLMGLLGAGIFAIMATQKQKNTENTMRAINKALVAQMKFVLDKADKEAIPPSVITLAGNDSRRARIIWKKLRLKQEFPMTFAEALTPYNTCAYCFQPVWPAGPAPYSPVLPADLPPLGAYKKALMQIGAANAAGQPIKTVNTPAQPFLESSVMLLLALQQNRGGASFSADQLGSYAADPASVGLKQIMDGWSNPVAFFRFPTSSDAPVTGNNDLDSTNPDKAGTASKFRDTLDPEGLLVNANWNNWSSWSNQMVGVYYYEQLCHVVHTPNSTAATHGNYAVWPRYMLPTLVSAGPDGKWGLNNMFGSYAGLNPNMSIDAGNIGASNDNIYSYRLGLDSRGD